MVLMYFLMQTPSLFENDAVEYSYKNAGVNQTNTEKISSNETEKSTDLITYSTKLFLKLLIDNNLFHIIIFLFITLLLSHVYLIINNKSFLSGLIFIASLFILMVFFLSTLYSLFTLTILNKLVFLLPTKYKAPFSGAALLFFLICPFIVILRYFSKSKFLKISLFLLNFFLLLFIVIKYLFYAEEYLNFVVVIIFYFYFIIISVSILFSFILSREKNQS